MENAASYIVTGHILEIARNLRREALVNLSSEDIEAFNKTTGDFLPEATELFMSFHNKIQKLLTEQSGD